MTGAEGRQLRTDAERNRGRIIESATAAFARHGLDVPLEDVADGAGVGIGTLYRRFRRARRAHWCLLRAAPGRVCERGRRSPCRSRRMDGFPSIRRTDLHDAGRGSRPCRRPEPLIAQRQVAGGTSGRGSSSRFASSSELRERSLRSDVVAEDLALLFMANAGVIEVTWGAARDAWRRSSRSSSTA